MGQTYKHNENQTRQARETPATCLLPAYILRQWHIPGPQALKLKHTFGQLANSTKHKMHSHQMF